jgi:hypothetical protein
VTTRDVSRPNEAETGPNEPWKIRGICSPDVPAVIGLVLLRRAKISRDSAGHWSDDDYNVFDGKRMRRAVATTPVRIDCCATERADLLGLANGRLRPRWHRSHRTQVPLPRQIQLDWLRHSDKNRNGCSRLSSQPRSLSPDRLLGETLPPRFCIRAHSEKGHPIGPNSINRLAGNSERNGQQAVPYGDNRASMTQRSDRSRNIPQIRHDRAACSRGTIVLQRGTRPS